jgi:hypothetical protein
VRDGIEVLVPDGRQHAQPHPEVLALPGRDGVRAAIHGHLVASRHESTAELLGEGLETAIGRRHAARAHDRDAHALLGSGVAMVSAARRGAVAKPRRPWAMMSA